MGDMEYLLELMREKEQLAVLANSFPKLEHLLDREIARVRMTGTKSEFRKNIKLKLPKAVGEKVMLQEKVFMPIKEHPEYNFVGRLLGPRGLTAKQLECETGCKIMIRGKGSMKDAAKERKCRGKPNFEHLNEDLHILVKCEDTKERAEIKLGSAISQIKQLIAPPEVKGTDELKRRQLMELALLNGTYRSADEKPQKDQSVFYGGGSRIVVFRL